MSDENAIKRASALQLWGEAHPIAGTLAAHYLADIRGIDLAALPAAIDEVLRFHPRCPLGSASASLSDRADAHAVVDTPTGIHRIALDAGSHEFERWTLGNIGVVKLWPAGSG